MIWIRISVHDGLGINALPTPAMVVYIIWFANSEYLLSGPIKAEWKDFIMEVKIMMSLFRTLCLFSGTDITMCT